jgi:hypothetical protein
MSKHRLLLAIAGSTLLLACNEPKNQRGATAVAHALALPQKDSGTLITAPASLLSPSSVRPSPAESGQYLPVPEKGAARTVLALASEPVFLQGPEGTIVSIAPNSLVLAGSGEAPKGPVSISIQEYISTAAILQANLSTTSGGRLLETAGMIYISATSEGAPCALMPGRTASVTFAGRRSGDGMQLFTGRMVNGGVDWELQEQEYFYDDVGECDMRRYVMTDPAFPNGPGALKQFLARRLDWPDDREGPVTTVDVVLSYEVNAQGLAGKPSIQSSLSPRYDSAFAAALQEMPRWRPATCNGSPVSATIVHRLSYWWPENASPGNARMHYNISPPAIDSTYPRVEPRRQTFMTFRTPSLGWINCDRFIEDSREKTEFFVNVSGDPDVKLVFHNIRSVMQGSPAAGKCVFPGVPKGEPVTVVAFRKEGTQLFMAMSDTNTGAEGLKELVFQKADKEMIRERLLQLDERIRRATALKPAGTEPGYVFQQSKTTR